MLIEVYERDIHNEMFDTLEKAQEEMKKSFLDSVGFDSMTEVLDRYEEDCDFALHDFDGWSNIHDTNIDYKIVKVVD